MLPFQDSQDIELLTGDTICFKKILLLALHPVRRIEQVDQRLLVNVSEFLLLDLFLDFHNQKFKKKPRQIPGLFIMCFAKA
jgi:hypothetical protein